MPILQSRGGKNLAIFGNVAGEMLRIWCRGGWSGRDWPPGGRVWHSICSLQIPEAQGTRHHLRSGGARSAPGKSVTRQRTDGRAGHNGSIDRGCLWTSRGRRFGTEAAISSRAHRPHSLPQLVSAALSRHSEPKSGLSPTDSDAPSKLRARVSFDTPVPDACVMRPPVVFHRRTADSTGLAFIIWPEVLAERVCAAWPTSGGNFSRRVSIDQATATAPRPLGSQQER